MFDSSKITEFELHGNVEPFVIIYALKGFLARTIEPQVIYHRENRKYSNKDVHELS